MPEGYTGLPNWGYGLQMPADTLLQLLPFTPQAKEAQQMRQFREAQINQLVQTLGPQLELLRAQTGSERAQTGAAEALTTQRKGETALQVPRFEMEAAGETARRGLLRAQTAAQETPEERQQKLGIEERRASAYEQYMKNAGAQDVSQMDEATLRAMTQTLGLVPAESYTMGTDPKTGKPTMSGTPNPMHAALLQALFSKFGIQAPQQGGGQAGADPNAAAIQQAVQQAMQGSGEAGPKPWYRESGLGMLQRMWPGGQEQVPEEPVKVGPARPAGPIEPPQRPRDVRVMGLPANLEAAQRMAQGLSWQDLLNLLRRMGVVTSGTSGGMPIVGPARPAGPLKPQGF